MDINELLSEQGITKYRLSKTSGVPYATISDICTGKASIEKCSGETLYKIAKALNVSMESLIEPSLEDREIRPSFEVFKSNACHRVKDMGDMDFIIETLESDRIRSLYDKGWYPESLYLLAMLDYLSRENEVPICTNYDDIRRTRLSEPIFPGSVIAASIALNDDKPKSESMANAIPEFMRFNIIESEVRNVC